jgi:hypothetical protein
MNKTISKAFLLLAALVLITQCANKDNKNWVARVNGVTIPLNQFNQRYQMYMEQLQQSQPMLRGLTPDQEKQIKRELIKQMIGEKLIFNELKKDGFDKSKDMKDLYQQLCIQKYLEKKFTDDLSASQGEIEKFYNENRAQFRMMDPEEAQQRIHQYLLLQKFKMKTDELIDRLYDKAKVVKNEEALLPMNIPQIMPTFNTNAKSRTK